MPIDASIPLSGNKSPDLLDMAGKAYTLKSAMLQSQQVEQKMKDDADLKRVLSDPAGFETDPQSGIPIPKPETMKSLYGINPSAAQKLNDSTMKLRDQVQKQQQQRQHMTKAFVEEAGPVLATLATEYEQVAKTGDPQAAWAAIKPKMDAANAEFGQKAQQYGLPFKPIETSDQLTMKASQWAKYAERQMRATQPSTPHETAMEGAPKSPAGKLEADYQAGKISKADRDKQMEKLNAPTPTMSLTGEGALTPEALTLAVDQFLAGDHTAAQGYARNAQMKAQFMNRLAARAAERGMKGEDVAAQVAEFQGIKAGQRTLGTRTANIEMAVTEAQNMAPLALTASEKVDRTAFPTLNKVILAAEQGTGGEDVVRLGIATNSLINIYARAISPTGVPTVSDKDHARELLSTAWSKGQYRAGIDQLMQELAAARKSPGQVREGMRGAVTRRGEPEAAPSGGGGGNRFVYDPATGTVKPQGGGAEPSKAVPQ